MHMYGEWDIDIHSGHLSHHSGLYAYLVGPPTTSGAVKCIGPFSTYAKRLSPNQVYIYSAAANRLLESLYDNRCSYTLWGSYTKPHPESVQEIQILGEPFRFIPNPVFRSCAILAESETVQCDLPSLHREWIQTENPLKIRHRLGLEFSFELPKDGKRIFTCRVEQYQTLDDEAISREIADLSYKALSTTALCVIRKLSPSTAVAGRDVGLTLQIGEGFV